MLTRRTHGGLDSVEDAHREAGIWSGLAGRDFDRLRELEVALETELPRNNLLFCRTPRPEYMTTPGGTPQLQL
jgi:hypothetical protein